MKIILSSSHGTIIYFNAAVIIMTFSMLIHGWFSKKHVILIIDSGWLVEQQRTFLAQGS